MAIDAIIRVSFQSSTQANQAANNALVGHTQNSTGSGPFERVGTAVYSCVNANDAAVAQALADLGSALVTYNTNIDFVAITLIRH